MCQNFDSSGYTALSFTTEDADGIVTEGSYLPDGVSVNETTTSCETVQSSCFKSVEVFAADNKITGLELTDSDDSVSVIGLTSDSSLGKAYFGDAGCLSSVDVFTDEDSDISSLVMYSVEGEVILEIGDVSTVACTLV
jgi:hypothetical protein